MSLKRHAISVLAAEDDEDDRLLLQEAFKEADIDETLRFVEDGEELLDYLEHRNQYRQPNTAPRPGLIILDLNMPKKNGREVLKEIKSSPAIKSIPVIILSTSANEEDIALAYGLGASSFIVKPLRFDALVQLIKVLAAYWFGIVELPEQPHD